MSEVKTRPCYVKGRKGLFHRWIEKEDFFIKANMSITSYAFDQLRRKFKETGTVPEGFDVDVIRNTYALIEFEDGHIEEIPPTTITFFDNDEYFKGIAWKEEKEERDTCSTCRHKNDPRCQYCRIGTGNKDDWNFWCKSRAK